MTLLLMTLLYLQVLVQVSLCISMHECLCMVLCKCVYSYACTNAVRGLKDTHLCLCLSIQRLIFLSLLHLLQDIPATLCKISQLLFAYFKCNATAFDMINILEKDFVLTFLISDDSSLSNIDCDFEASDACHYQQETNDDFDWSRSSQSTITVGTGPSSDHTYGTSSGQNLMIKL